MASSIHNNLDQFIANFLSYHDASGHKLTVTYDSAWPSPCYSECAGLDVENGAEVLWRPKFQTENNSFSNVEEALGYTLNEDYCQFFTRYYSDNLPAIAKQGACELLQVWNAEDFARLQQNLIGHLLMKQRLKQAPTLFFALTDDEDFILSVVNETGEVVLEQVGLSPKEIISPCLGDFIAGLQPG